MTNQKLEKGFFQYTPFVHDPNWIPIAKWIRGYFGKEYIASSQRVMLKREFPMTYYFPREDVKMELLEKERKSSNSNEWGGYTYWKLKTGGKKVENAAWSYEKPSDNAPENIENYIAFKWDAMDAWFEEDEEVRVHPRDPYHRIDICPGSRHVQIRVAGETIAETRRPVLLFETGLPARYYIPKTDVRLDLLHPTDHQTHCPYKGTASYYSVMNGGENLQNLVWTYPYPQTESYMIKDLVAFYTEKLDDVYIDGMKLPKMETKWSY